jgi:hypothetical protein
VAALSCGPGSVEAELGADLLAREQGVDQIYGLIPHLHRLGVHLLSSGQPS